MTTPGTRQKVAQLIFAYVNAPLRPIEPMASPMQTGWSLKRQAS
jgi:hypothetical protein